MQNNPKRERGQHKKNKKVRYTKKKNSEKGKGGVQAIASRVAIKKGEKGHVTGRWKSNPAPKCKLIA